MHRFVWDLHYALPESVRGSYFGPLPPTAVPGTYTIKLSANGQTQSQPLVLKMDPRVKTSQVDLERMFQAESRITRNLGQLSSALKKAEALQSAIAAKKKEAASNAELNDTLSALERRNLELLGTEAEPEFAIFGLAPPAKHIVTLREANPAMTGLLFAVQGSDAAPTADAIVAIEKWDAATKEVLARWGAFWEQDREHANSLLQKANLKPL
jgi:hypothetical protein